MRGAVILSCAGLAAKILSAFYRIPFQNIVGNTGFYVYQQVYPIYGIGMTFALSGFPVYISKLIAEQENELHRLQLSRQIFLVLACFGIFVFAFLQFFFKTDCFFNGRFGTFLVNQKHFLDVFVHADAGRSERILSGNL